MKKCPAILATVLAVSITAVLSGCSTPSTPAGSTSASTSTSTTASATANAHAVKPGVQYKLAGITVEDSAYEKFGPAAALVTGALEELLKELHSHPEIQKSDHLRKESDVNVFADGGLKSHMEPSMWEHFAENWVDGAPLWPYVFDPIKNNGDSGEKFIIDVNPTSEGLHAVYDGSKARAKLLQAPKGGYYLEVSWVELSFGVNTTDNRTLKGTARFSYSFFPVLNSSEDEVVSWSLVTYDKKDWDAKYTDEN